MNEAENTARLLKDENPLVTSRWCYIGLHSWEQWGKAYAPNKNKWTHIQTRHCVHCNKIEVQRVNLPSLD
jgi:hypothetical protein